MSRSGLASAVLSPGRGTVHPYDLDLVRLRFVGWTKAGKVFDATGDQPAPTRVHATFPPGLSEGLRLMVAGEKRRLWIPAALGFPQEAQANGLPAGDLVMDVELVEIVPTPLPPPAPADANGPPPGTAHQTGSGISYRLLASGGKTAPRATRDSIVVYNYTTWTSAGTLLDSTIPEGQPQSAPLAQLEPHWRDALSVMKVGDKLRFWFVGKQPLARSGAPPPSGSASNPLLVVDVELLYVYAVESRG